MYTCKTHRLVCVSTPRLMYTCNTHRYLRRYTSSDPHLSHISLLVHFACCTFEPHRYINVLFSLIWCTSSEAYLITSSDACLIHLVRRMPNTLRMTHIYTPRLTHISHISSDTYLIHLVRYTSYTPLTHISQPRPTRISHTSSDARLIHLVRRTSYTPRPTHVLYTSSDAHFIHLVRRTSHNLF